MPSPVRLALVAAFAIACHGALAQTVVPPTLSVQRIAPQLVAFAGSPSNFQNLVTGLSQGTPVQLITLLPDGFTQVATFTPVAPLAPEQIAQVLETARQRLIGLGISAPTAEQLAVTLMGGVVPTTLGGSQVGALLVPQNPPSPAVQAQANAAAGATVSTSPTPSLTSTTPPVNVQLIPGVSTSTSSNTAPQRVNTSDSLTPAGATSRSAVPAAPTTPGVAPAPTSIVRGAEPAPGTPAPPAATPPAATPPATNIPPAVRGLERR